MLLLFTICTDEYYFIMVLIIIYLFILSLAFLQLRNDLMALDVILTLLGVCMLLLSVSAVVVSTKALTGKAIIISVSILFYLRLNAQNDC